MKSGFNLRRLFIIELACLLANVTLLANKNNRLAATERAPLPDLNQPPPPEPKVPAAAVKQSETKSQHKRSEPSADSSWLSAMKKITSERWRTFKEKLPAYFDFSRWRRTFGRWRYDENEVTYRKARFLTRCIEIFKKRVLYRTGRLHHLESTNMFTDRSPNELKNMFMSLPPFEMLPPDISQEEYLRRAAEEKKARSAWDLELESQSALEYEGQPFEQASDTTIISEAGARNELNKLIHNCDKGILDAIIDEYQDNGIERASQISIMDESEPLPWPGEAPIYPDYGMEVDVDEISTNNPPELLDFREFIDWSKHPPYTPPEFLGPRKSIDWSEHPCFHQVYIQALHCGNCYAIATTTLAEFYKCSEKKDELMPRKFSKEYVTYCGEKFSPTIMGCIGGSILDTLRFISEAGIYNIKSWREKRIVDYRAAKKEGAPASFADCPINPFLKPFNEWGEVRVDLIPKMLHPNQWLEALQSGPIVVVIQMPGDSAIAYAGGTHSGEDCATTGNWHAMVLVGYGTDEFGTHFWRFRNSWGSQWGDRGHFNMAMSAPGSCFVGGVRVFRSNFD